jgi:hypothetical protein
MFFSKDELKDSVLEEAKPLDKPDFGKGIDQEWRVRRLMYAQLLELASSRPLPFSYSDSSVTLDKLVGLLSKAISEENEVLMPAVLDLLSQVLQQYPLPSQHEYAHFLEQLLRRVAGLKPALQSTVACLLGLICQMEPDTALHVMAHKLLLCKDAKTSLICLANLETLLHLALEREKGELIAAACRKVMKALGSMKKEVAAKAQ